MKISAPDIGRQKLRAFSPIEVLVIIVMIGVLAVILLPSLGRSKSGRQIFCMTTQKQLVLAWIMYAQDNADKLVPCQGETNSAWCAGNMARWPDCTNANPIVNGTLYPYARNLSLYHCPNDLSTVDPKSGKLNPSGGSGVKRLRSISLNSWLNGPTNQVTDPTQTVFRKITEIGLPINTIVFIDENPATIDDAVFVTKIPDSAWSDVPASYHKFTSGAAGMSFADGHAMLHRWQDPTILGNEAPKAGRVPKDGGVDLKWLQQHVTTFATNQFQAPPP